MIHFFGNNILSVYVLLVYFLKMFINWLGRAFTRTIYAAVNNKYRKAGWH